MLKLSLLVFIFFQMNSIVQASVETFGHNLSHTDTNMAENTCTAGVQIIACGNTDFLIGTSPFLLKGYNMMNLYIRKNISRSKDINHTIELALFDTFGESLENYSMKAFWAYYITTFNIGTHYKIHLNTILGYYADDKYPFSLRRPTIKRLPYQVNISTLHEGILSENVSLIGELGILHVTDTYPRIHSGISLAYKSKNFLFQLGFSLSSTLYALDPDANFYSRKDYQRELISTYEGYNGVIDPQSVKYDFSIHPEIALQLYF